jgi:hypothetical protein
MTKITRIPAPVYEQNKDFDFSIATNPEDCALIADYLSSAFNWYMTAEGQAFWLAVTERIRNIGEGEPLK